MDFVLDLFDFGGKSGTQPPLPTVPNIGSLESTVARVEEAAATGSIPLLSQAFSDAHALWGSNIYHELSASALYVTIRHLHREPLEYLLAEHVAVTPDAVATAAMAKDEWTLDLSLRSGWDIDESISPAAPSALA